jgi:hypothetical protein
MVRSESVSLDTQSLLVTLHGLIIFANLQEDCGIVPEDSNVSMVGAKNIVSNTKTLHEALLRDVELLLLEEDQSNGVQGSNISVTLSQMIPVDVKSLLVQFESGAVLLHLVLYQAYATQGCSNVDVIRTKNADLHHMNVTVLPDGCNIVAALLVDLSNVDEGDHNVRVVGLKDSSLNFESFFVVQHGRSHVAKFVGQFFGLVQSRGYMYTSGWKFPSAARPVINTFSKICLAMSNSLRSW